MSRSNVLKWNPQQRMIKELEMEKRMIPGPASHIKPVDESDIIDSHKPLPSVVTADDTIGLHQESCGLVVNDVADVQNSSRSRPVMSPNNNERHGVSGEAMERDQCHPNDSRI